MNDKQSLIKELKNTHQKIVGLINTLSDKELFIPYHPGVNPPLWEVGHAAFFFEVFILKALDKAESFDPSMDDIWDSFNIDHEDRWRPDMIPSKENTLNYVNEIHQSILARIENNELTQDESVDELAMNEIGKVSLKLTSPLTFDRYADNRATGSFIIIDSFTNNTVGAAMIC